MDAVFTLSPSIHVLPIRHGSGDMAQEVREFLLGQRFDCLALPLPPSIESVLEQGIHRLPAISVVSIPEPEQEGAPVYSFVPVDPCQAIIMGVRVAISEDIARVYIDRDVTIFEPPAHATPDPYALKRVSLGAYVSTILPSLPSPLPESQQWKRIAWMAFRLHALELDYPSVLCLCSIEDWPWLRMAYQDRLPFDNPELLEGHPILFQPTLPSLYFLLGELPFVTERYERRRRAARSDNNLSIDGVKELVLEARGRWLTHCQSDGRQESQWLTPKLLQMYLQYVRNVTLLERRLTPDLYTLILAARQMVGDAFALTLLETAKEYSFQQDESWASPLPEVEIGLGRMKFPDGEIAKSKNRLQGQPVVWRSLPLRPLPPQPKKRRWAYQWNPYRQCSWPPEDTKIETFTTHVRHQAQTWLGMGSATTEKFTASLHDGLDIRETLRHRQGGSQGRPWDLYVKDEPPARGHLEAIVFLFEVPADPGIFSWRAIWYAEHENESTLCFFATPFSENMVGPGIGQSRYGGALFLFPPQVIPDIWEDGRFDFASTLEERLIAAACAHSHEKYVALVSSVSCRIQWRRIAHRYRRRLIPLPLSRFSGQTIDRLRRFHVLNGHDIRSYAAQFIQP